MIQEIRAGQHYTSSGKTGKLNKAAINNLRRRGWVLHHCYKCGRQFMSKDKGTYLKGKGYKHICHFCINRMVNE